MQLGEYGFGKTPRPLLALALFARRVGEPGLDLDLRLSSGPSCTPPPRASQQHAAGNASRQRSRGGTGPVEQLRPACFVAEDVCGNTRQTVTGTDDIPSVSIRVRLHSQARLWNDEHPALIDLTCVGEDAAVSLSPSHVGGVDAFVARPVPI